MYFVSYTTNRLELPTPGWNVWIVKENKKSPGNGRSFKILKILIGGKRRPDAKSVSATDGHIFQTERDVIERIFDGT